MIIWELSAPGTPVREVATLDDDGRIAWRISHPATTDHPQLGWWTGVLDKATMATARSLAGPSASGGAQTARPPAAGGWSATTPAGRIALWAGDDATRAGLRSVLAACRAAATVARATARLSATIGGVAGDPVLILQVASIGSEELHVLVADPGGGGASGGSDDLLDELGGGPGPTTAVFLTDEAEVVGFLGEEVWLPAGTTVKCVLRGRSPGPHGLVVTGTMATAADEPVGVAATVAVGAVPSP